MSTDTAMSRELHSVWQTAAEAQREMLDSITFAELAERVQGHSENMYYI